MGWGEKGVETTGNYLKEEEDTLGIFFFFFWSKSEINLATFFDLDPFSLSFPGAKDAAADVAALSVAVSPPLCRGRRGRRDRRRRRRRRREEKF